MKLLDSTRFYLLVFLTSASGIWFTSGVHTQSTNIFIRPPQYLHNLAFGHRETLADTLWLRAIQGFDYCGQKDSSDFQKKPEHQVSQKSDRHVATPPKWEALNELMKQPTPLAICDRGWVYVMMDKITDLSPRFRIAYTVGATTLSILLSDKEGARLIFEKGLKAYPNDWVLAYRAAYHFLFEYQDAERAAELLMIAAENGAPFWVPILAARLYSKAGKALFGRNVLLNYLKENPEGVGADRAKMRLQELDAELASQGLIPPSND